MKKLFTFAFAALLSAGVWAETAILSWQMGENGAYAEAANVITGATGCAAEGWTIAITGNTSKNWTAGNGKIFLNGDSIMTLKNSNGAQNTVNSTKIADIEQSMTKNEKFIFKLKSKNSKNQIFKCLLLRNINNIICSGEFILEEGLSWYKLNEIKNNTMSKESLITSSTSKGNILNTNGNISQNLDLKSHYLSDINLILENNINLANKNHNSKKYEDIKIKLMVN